MAAPAVLSHQAGRQAVKCRERGAESAHRHTDEVWANSATPEGATVAKRGEQRQRRRAEQRVAHFHFAVVVVVLAAVVAWDFLAPRAAQFKC